MRKGWGGWKAWLKKINESLEYRKHIFPILQDQLEDISLNMKQGKNKEKTRKYKIHAERFHTILL